MQEAAMCWVQLGFRSSIEGRVPTGFVWKDERSRIKPWNERCLSDFWKGKLPDTRQTNHKPRYFKCLKRYILCDRYTQCAFMEQTIIRFRGE